MIPLGSDRECSESPFFLDVCGVAWEGGVSGSGGQPNRRRDIVAPVGRRKIGTENSVLLALVGSIEVPNGYFEG